MGKPLHVVPPINSLLFFAKFCDNLLHNLNLDPNAIPPLHGESLTDISIFCIFKALTVFGLIPFVNGSNVFVTEI